MALLEEESELPVFQVLKVSANQSPDLSLVTRKVLSGNFIRFEIDTGARCNGLYIFTRRRPVILTSSMLSLGQTDWQVVASRRK